MSKQNKQQTNTTSMETLWKVLRFIGKYRFLLVLSIILAAVSVILQLYVPVLFGNAIDQVVAKRDVVLSQPDSCDDHRFQCCYLDHEYH